MRLGSRAVLGSFIAPPPYERQLMSDRAALLTAIRKYPDDDTPRLVYADLVQEKENAERAELIRTPCELERLGRFGPRSDQLASRRNVILEQCAPKWRAELPRIPGTEWGHHPTRGFFEEVTVAAAALHDHGATIQAASPVTRPRSTRAWCC
jgi:uncharacterized protein (TIGR02996 family)